MKKVYHKIEEISGPVIRLKSTGVSYGELARIYLKDGTKTFGQVIKIYKL